MKAPSRCLLILVAVACRAEDNARTTSNSEPPTSAAAVAPIDTRPSGPAEEAIVEAPPAIAGSATAPATATATERQASARAPSNNAARPTASQPSMPSLLPSPSAPAPATETQVAPRRGGSASGPSYETWLETTGGYTSGASASVIAVVNAKAPYKCNTQYPYKFVLDPPASGLTFPSSTARGMKVDGKRATMPIAFVASSAGSHTVGGTLSFSTCTEDKCLVDKAHLTVVVQVR